MSPKYASKHAKRILLALAVSFVPSVARADSTCDLLFTTMREWLKHQPDYTRSSIGVIWTTNYQTTPQGLPFISFAKIHLQLQGTIIQDLKGDGTRYKPAFTFLDVPPVNQPHEHVTLRIRLDGTVTFNDAYGPYNPVCSGRRYAVVHTGHSIEVFTFYNFPG